MQPVCQSSSPWDSRAISISIFTPAVPAKIYQVDAGSSQPCAGDDDTQVGALVPSHNIENLPANGGTYSKPAENNAAPFQNAAGPVSNFKTTSKSRPSAGRPRANPATRQDGVTNIAVLTKTANFQPPIEATQEVLIIQNGASARYDEPSVMNVVTRGGARTASTAEFTTTFKTMH